MTEPDSNAGSIALRVAATYSVVVGVLLVAWWAATWTGVIHAALAPAQLEWSHVAAEAVAAILALAGGLAVLVSGRRAAPLLAAAFGAVLYADVNVLVDFAGRIPMFVGLCLGAAGAVAGLIVSVRESWGRPV